MAKLVVLDFLQNGFKTLPTGANIGIIKDHQ